MRTRTGLARPFDREIARPRVSEQPGDVIATGTPPGVGLGRKPPRWLRPGETLASRVEGLGKLRNRVVAEAA